MIIRFQFHLQKIWVAKGMVELTKFKFLYYFYSNDSYSFLIAERHQCILQKVCSCNGVHDLNTPNSCLNRSNLASIFLIFNPLSLSISFWMKTIFSGIIASNDQASWGYHLQILGLREIVLPALSLQNKKETNHKADRNLFKLFLCH